MPEHFRGLCESWGRRNPGWERRLWTDADLLALVETRYPEWRSAYFGLSRGHQPRRYWPLSGAAHVRRGLRRPRLRVPAADRAAAGQGELRHRRGAGGPPPGTVRRQFGPGPDPVPVVHRLRPRPSVLGRRPGRGQGQVRRPAGGSSAPARSCSPAPMPVSPTSARSAWRAPNRSIPFPSSTAGWDGSTTSKRGRRPRARPSSPTIGRAAGSASTTCRSACRGRSRPASTAWRARRRPTPAASRPFPA